ncbi:MAG: TonB-dependent receptor [Halieaceae bacterium]|jgi:outer membrane receptor protein involved in Fe transport|nr:TonB-dependent receptor [Halieaceae bacterium]
MQSNNTLRRAVRAAALGTAASGSLFSLESSAQLEEVIVTATKRAESTQDIPVAVQALGENTLNDMGVTNFEDYLVQLPGVTAGGSGPGQNTIYIRGVASTTPNLSTAGVAGLAPNVALYLDEQPLAQPGRNLDVYAADMNRIEVLAGPQGTLFGASSQAGTVRLITNKPDFSGTYARTKLGTSFTKGGEMNNNLEAMLNVPVSDKLALRGVVYTDHMGGYVDNVPGTVNVSESARFRPAGTLRANGVPVSEQREGFQAGADLSAVNFIDADNDIIAEDNYNDATYTGFRLAGTYLINANWDLNVSYMKQQLDVDGVFYSDPELGDYEVTRFTEDNMKDEFDNVSWTLQGRLNALEVLYTGAFTQRDTDQIIDYTDYLFVGQYMPYYVCDASVTYPGDAAPSGTCYAPEAAVNSLTETDVQTHELRFTTPQDNRFRATFGAFYSDLELREVNDFIYSPDGFDLVQGPGPFVPAGTEANPPVGFGPNFSMPGASVKFPGQWPQGTMFRNDVIRTDEQTALFGELTFDIVDDLALTLGARYYDVEVTLKGSASGSYGNLGATQDNASGQNLDELFSDPNPSVAATDGVITKVSLSWTPTDEQLWFATISEGFRPGLLNRPGGASNPDGSFTVPFALDTDEVVNYELGWKLDLLDRSLRFNGSLFLVEIDSLQTTIFDPSITNLFFSDNAADAEVMGVEGSIDWAPSTVPGLVVTGAFSVLDTEITRVLTPTDDVIRGDSLAFAPELQTTLRARYTWDLANGMRAHVMPHLAYSDESFSDVITINRQRLDSWLMLGFTAGLSSNEWTAELFVDNLTDEAAELSMNFVADRDRVTLARPLTGGLRFTYNFD